LICIGAGIVTGFAGVLMAWDARLHNAIVANTVENPWPGYLVATLGIGLIVVGIVVMVRRRQSPAEAAER
jgi:H+/Cl- antiporter ClcA